MHMGYWKYVKKHVATVLKNVANMNMNIVRNALKTVFYAQMHAMHIVKIAFNMYLLEYDL